MLTISIRTRLHLVVVLIGAACLAGPANGAEMTVQNDSLVGGSSGVIQAGFAAGESAAAWLTSPCNGDIVAVQVFWRSTTGTTGQSIEDSINIFNGGTFPNPGTLLDSVMGPVMNDGVINEFRYLDENQVIPLIVPVTNGQKFIVAFKFLNAPNQTTGPSVVNDTDGCQAGKNTIDAQGFGWISSCLLGVGGDWVIRAVVNCAPTGGSGSVPDGATRPGQPLQMALVAGQLVLTWGSSCSATDNDYGVYQGFIGAYYSHFSKVCTTGGATTTSFAPDGFNRYYLVVPHDGIQEGSYGLNRSGAERPQGGGACEGVQTVTCP